MRRLPVTFSVSRRHLLQGLAVSPLALGIGAPLLASTAQADFLLVSLADLHSPYRNLPAVLQTIRDLRAESPDTPMAITINGDIFERGNVAARRSEAAADWQFVEALTGIAPLIINLGNHETAIIDDMASFVARAEATGAVVVSNILDRRTGRLFAPATAELDIGGPRVGFVGLAATNPFVYREAVRDTLGLLDPVDFARAALGDAMAGVDVPVILSHAGVVADRATLRDLSAGTLIIGGHDHLMLDHEGDGTRYFHGGSWGNTVTVVGIRRRSSGPEFSVDTVPMTADRPRDEDLDATIRAILAEHLTDEDRAVIAELSRPRDLAESILFATDAVRSAVEADVAFLGHTTFGTGLPAGDVTRYDFDAFVRFDGEIRTATVTGERLAAIMTMANQHRASNLDQRTGDFVHAREIDIDPSASYRIATNDWTAQNQQAYLGTSDIAFETVDGVMLKPTVEAALGRL